MEAVRRKHVNPSRETMKGALTSEVEWLFEMQLESNAAIVVIRKLINGRDIKMGVVLRSHDSNLRQAAVVFEAQL